MAEPEAWAQRWRELSEPVLSDMQAWRTARRTVPSDQPIALRRRYGTCAARGTGLVLPG
jgi:hypothetical protein